MLRKWRRKWERSKAERNAQGANPLKLAAKRLVPPLVAAGIMLSSIGIGYANPTGGQVTTGSGSISSSGNTMTITQNSNKLGINWQSFSIGSGETVNFIQPGASSIALNRVLGNNASSIYGHLNANGQVFLINPNGVLFAPGAQVNVGGIAASTLNISDSDFLSGNYTFSGSGGSVTNQGTITAANGGYVALLGSDVKNDGVIVAQKGTVALAAGNAVTMDMNGDGLLNLAVNQAAVDASAANHNLIQADGGQVIMTANAANALARTVVNNSGIIQARSIDNTNGVIRLDGGTSGTVTNSGTLDASGRASGQTGGTVKVLGEAVSIADGAKVNVAGDRGGGTALIGGNYQGKGPEHNATTTTVAKGATINADAITSGNGGSVAVWANNTTTFNGTISAKGGATSGDGGQVETSGHQTLTLGKDAKVVTTAAHGKTGNWLLDPTDFTIGTGTTGANYWNNVDLGNALGSSNITVQTAATGSDPGDITVAAPVSWSSANTLTLSAYRDINVNANITGTGGGNLVLRADNTGTDTGTVTLNPSVLISLTGGSGSGNNVTIYYNPTASGNGGFTSKYYDYNALYNGSYAYVSENAASGLGGNYSYGNPYMNQITTGSEAAGTTSRVNGSQHLNVYMLVNNISDLKQLSSDMNGANDVRGSYALGADINASTLTQPLLNFNGGGFFGAFNGAGHVISYLTIPLFLQTNSGSSVTNLGLVNMNIGSTNSYYGYPNLLGGLACNASGYFANDYVTGSVNGTTNNTGGLFGSITSGSTVTNCYNAATVTSSGSTVGGLAAANSGTIINSYNSGAVSTGAGGISIVGGLVGTNNSGGTISNSYNTGALTVSEAGSTYNWGPYGVGGLAGLNQGTITNSYSVAPVTVAVGDDQSSPWGDNYMAIGGLVGMNQGAITNSYSTSAVTVTANHTTAWVSPQTLDVGGLVGMTESRYGGSGIVNNSYSTGKLTITDSNSGDTPYNYFGSVVGNASGSSSVSNCYWNSDNEKYSAVGYNDGTSTTSNLTGLTTKQMLSAASYSGWDFGSTWYLVEGYTYPFLRSEYSTTITNPHQLQLMALNPAASYSLANAVDMLSYNMAPLVGFATVGASAGSPFSGSFNGNDYQISNLTESGPAGSAAGLFGYLGSSAIVHDVGLLNFSVSGGTAGYVGALAGNNAGSIYNVFGTGAVTGSGTVGGLVGANSGTLKTACDYITVTGTGASDILGGLVGQNSGSIADSAYYGSKVSGSGAGDTIGGLVGNNSGSITDSYSMGAVAGSGTVGGLVGANTGTAIDSMWVTDASGKNNGAGSGSTAGMTGLTESDALTPGNAVYTNWSSTTWTTFGGQHILAWSTSGGIMILTPGQLAEISSYLNGTYFLAGNLELTGTWTPLGTQADPFTGKFYGNNYTIDGLDIEGSGSNAIGLFAYTSGATITNLNLTNVKVVGGAGNQYVGSLVGYGIGGLVANCTVSGNVSSSGYTGGNLYVGGLAGYSSAEISASTSSGTVASGGAGGSGSSYVGGLVGENDLGGTISSSSSTAAVTASGDSGGNYGYIGGLTGQNNGAIDSSSSSNALTDNENGAAVAAVGGLAGQNSGSITNSYSIATITANSAGDQVGGLVGQQIAGTIANSNYTGTALEADGAGSSLGGLVGQLTGGKVENSTNSATVTDKGAGSYVGGLVGYVNWSGNYTSINGTNSGTVTATTAGSYVGGLVGYDSDAGGDSVSGTNKGAVTDTAGNSGAGITVVGGLVGYSQANVSGVNSGAVTAGANSYVGGLAGQADGNVSGNNSGAISVTGNGSYVGGLVGQNSYSSNVSGTNYGVVTVTGDSNVVGGIDGQDWGGDVSATNNQSGTVTVSGSGNKVGGIVGDLEYGTISAYGVAYNYGNVMVSGASNDVGGLAGYSNGAAVNSGYNEATISVSGAGSNVGGVVGHNLNSGSITGVYNTGTVTTDSTSSGSNVGGVVGYNESSATVAQSSNSGVVVTQGANSNVGGLAGENAGSITTSYSVYSGTLNTVSSSGATSNVGGLVGQNDAGGTVADSYFFARIISTGATSNVGGLIGNNLGSISTTYSVGAVSGTADSSVGGAIGLNSGTASDVLWDTDRTGQNSVGSGATSGVQGLTSEQMMQPGAYSSNWDFTNTWGTVAGLGGNSLPYFRWQYPTTPTVISGRVLDGSSGIAGQMVELFGSGGIYSTISFGANGYYNIVVPSLSAAENLGKNGHTQMLFLAVGDNPNFKANSIYDVVEPSYDLYKDTLYMVGNGISISDGRYTSSTSISEMCAPYGAYTSDLLYTIAVPAGYPSGYGGVNQNDRDFTVTGNLVATGMNLVGVGAIKASGSITIDDRQDTSGDYWMTSYYNSSDGWGAARTISAGGDITIMVPNNFVIMDAKDSSGVYNYTPRINAGGNVTISCGGDFINFFGADAIKAGGRYLVYATDQLLSSADATVFYYRHGGPGAAGMGEYDKLGLWNNLVNGSGELAYDTRGGLASDFVLWGTSYGSSNIPATGSGFIYSSSSPLIRPLTATQLMRQQAEGAVQAGSIARPAVFLPTAAEFGQTDLPLLTVVGKGVNLPADASISN